MSFTILLVEDDPDSRNALSLLLELEGFNILTASEGGAALELAKKHFPDLIITDICMPGMSGIELTRFIRSNTTLKNLPIIAVTAAAEQTRQDVLREGAMACFDKPLDVSALHNTIYSLLPEESAAVSRIA